MNNKIKWALKIILSIIFVFGISDAEASAQVKTSGRIWIAGDSIAADHSYENEADYARFVHGWGEVIGNYLNENAQVFNMAISGQSAKYFVEEDNYKKIIDGIGEGDLLLIQFGHNDYKSDGVNHYSLPTSTEGSYKSYLKNYYIDPALKKGAIPVLCTSVVCCEFVDGIVKEDQPQSLFAGAMRELYNEYKEQGIEIGLIDTYELTQSQLNMHSSEASSYYALKYDRGRASTSLDHVHFSEKGADMTAQIIAENLFVMYPDFNRYNSQNLTDGGNGTKEEPYLISSMSQFYRILQDNTKNNKNVYCKLTKDLDGTVQNKENDTIFYANFDGDGHVIYNAAGRASDSFIDKNYGKITNLVLQYSLHHTSENIQYPFVKENYGTISSCSAEGSIWYDCFLKENEEWFCGVFAGINEKDGIIENCSNNIEITVNTDTPNTYLGGITGKNNGKIKSCTNGGKLKIDMTYYSSKDKTKYETVSCISGGIAAVSADDAEVTECESSVLPSVMSTLEAEKIFILKDYLFVKDDFADSQILKGDADSDGNITLSDVALTLKAALGIDIATEKQTEAMDIDGDGKVSLSDTLSILKAALLIA